MFSFPRGADWMTLEESADRKMDQNLSLLLNALDATVDEKNFLLSIDSFYEDSKKIIPRVPRDEFDRIVLMVIEAIIRKKFSSRAFYHMLAWKFDLHRKNQKLLTVDEIPQILKEFIENKKTMRIEGLVDFYVKKQNTAWFNPYIDVVGQRPAEIYELKLLYKELSKKLISNDDILGIENSWRDLFSELKIHKQQYLVIKIFDQSIILASRKIKTLTGESVEFLLYDLKN